MTSRDEGRPTAAERLKAIGKAMAQKRAEEAANSAADQSREARRHELFEDAQRSLAPILDSLRERVVQAAPSANVSSDPALIIRLGDGVLAVDPVAQTPPDSLAAFDYEPPFDVIAHSAIAVRKPLDRYSYEGRSHSLWFCDAQEEKVYRWYELAFMVQPLIAQRFTLDPFALPPTDEDAAGSLTPVVTVRQVAWSPEPFDQGNEDQRMEHWAQQFWFK